MGFPCLIGRGFRIDLSLCLHFIIIISAMLAQACLKYLTRFICRYKNMQEKRIILIPRIEHVIQPPRAANNIIELILLGLT